MSDKGLDQVILSVGAIIADLDFYSYYQLLEVDQDASTDVITYNYNLKAHELDQAKRNPACNARLKQDITLLRDRMDEALQVLGDRASRMAYDRGLELGEIRYQPAVEQRSGVEETPPAPVKPTPIKEAYDRNDDDYLTQATDDLKSKLGDDLLHSEPDEEEAHDGNDHEYLEQVTDDLKSKLGDELLHSGPDDEDIEDVPAPVDQEEIQRLTDDMRFKLAQAGIELKVKEGFEGLDDFSGIDPEYLSAAVSELEQKLAKLGVDLEEEEAEVEDRSANADFASDLVADLQQELAAMGLDMFDVVEVVDARPEEELLDDEGLPAERPQAPPPPKPTRVQPPSIALPPELTVDVERLMREKAAPAEPEVELFKDEPAPEPEPEVELFGEEEETEEEAFEDAIRLDADQAPAPRAARPRADLPALPNRDDEDDAIPLILLDGEKD